MEQVQWKLREYLQVHEIPTLRLESAASPVSRQTLYRITSPDPKKRPSGVDFGTLSAIVKGLRLITGERVKVGDVLEYEFRPEKTPAPPAPTPE